MMSEQILEQLKTDPRFKNLPPRDLQRIADLTAQLRQVSLFDTLSDLDLALVAEHGWVERHERGDVIIHEGDTDKVLYVILSGQLRVWRREKNGRPRLLNYHGEGDFCGELIFLSGERRAANVDVVDDATLAAFGPPGFERIMAQHQIADYLRSWGRERIHLSNQYFEGKHWDEVAVVLAHKSWVALMLMIFLPVVIILLTLTSTALLRDPLRQSFNIVISIALAIVVGMGLWIFWMWEDWHNDDFIVTSKRIIHIERVLVPPFPVERHEALIHQVQDIITRNHALLTWLFGVNSLEIKTAGAGTIQFPYLDDAEGIRAEIFRARRLALTRRSGEEKSRVREKLLTELGKTPQTVTHVPDGQEAAMPSETPQRTGLLRAIDYFIPRTRIVRRDQIIWRKHWLVLLRQAGPAFLLFILSLGVLVVAIVRPGLKEIRWIYTGLPALVLTGVSFGWYLWRYDGWRNDIYIVTDDRIIDIEGSPFHFRGESRTEGTFDVIQNTNSSSPNWLARILRIGDVTIDTASISRAFTFNAVPRPDEVQQEIFKRLTAFKERRAREESERRYNELAKWFETYHHSVLEKE
jgi:hypothetical protein